jgi:cobalt-zinc-cadmium efflux system outer membrane protein
MWEERRAARRALAISLAGSVVCAGAAAAQIRSSPASPAAITFDEAAREAIDHNLTLIAERYNVSIAQARQVTAALRPNPVLTLNGMFPTSNALDNGVSPREQVVRTDFVFERGGKRERRIEAADEAKSVAELQLLDSMRTLVLDVQNACVDVALATHNLTLAQESLDAFNAVVRVNIERVRTGDLAPVELSRSRLASLQFQNDVRIQESKLVVAQNRLKGLLGRSDSRPIEVDGDLRHDAGPVDLDAIRERALAARPDLRALKAEQARTAADLRLQIAQGKVDYTVSGEVHRQFQPPLTDSHGYVYGIYLSVPLPIFNRNQGEVARAGEEERQAAARVTAREAEVRRELEAAYQNYAAARDVVANIENRMLDQAREVRTTTEYSYRRGEASLIEFLDAVRAFNDTMHDYNDARAEFARSLYSLDSLAGGTSVPLVAP